MGFGLLFFLKLTEENDAIEDKLDEYSFSLLIISFELLFVSVILTVSLKSLNSSFLLLLKNKQKKNSSFSFFCIDVYRIYLF